MGLFLVFATLMFVVGSAFFLKADYSEDRLKWGDTLFIVASVIFFSKSVHTIATHHKEHGMQPLEERHVCAEYFENVFYTLSCVIFIAACILFWPGLFSEHNAIRAEIVAVWLFIIGSMGFMLASYCNAILLAKKELFHGIPFGYGKIVYNIAFAALLNSQIGGVFFVTGSFMFLPGFRTHCERDIRADWTQIAAGINSNLTTIVAKMSSDFHVSESEILKLMPPHGICQDILQNGAILYIIGSFFYFVQSCLYLICSLIKSYAKSLAEHDGSRTVSADTDETELFGNLPSSRSSFTSQEWP